MVHTGRVTVALGDLRADADTAARATAHPAARVATLLAALMIVLSSCAPPDRPDALPQDIPAAALDFLDAEPGWTEVVAPGVQYRFAEAPGGPWRVHLLSMDAARCELGFTVLPRPAVGGRAKVTELADPATAGVLAAINGDFFTEEGRPLGIEVSRGEVRARSPRAAFAWHPGSGPWFGIPSAQADSLLFLGWTLPFGRADGSTEAIAGFPALLMEGEPVGDLEVSARPSFAAERHPRTAIAYDRPGQTAWLVVVEGRLGESAGMSLPELTELLLALGATEALNLDGGGSSAMVIQGRLVSRPADASGERAVANALGLRRDAGFCDVPQAPAVPSTVTIPIMSVAP